MKKVLSVLFAVVMLTAVLAVAVAATEYPSVSVRDYYVVEVTADGDGTATAETVTPQKGDTTKLIARPGDGSEFTGWTFEGEFEWVEGGPNSPVIVIRPKGDVKFVAHFKGASRDTTPTSPTTGYNTAAVIAVMTAVLSVSVAVVVCTGKKYFSAK